MKRPTIEELNHAFSPEGTWEKCIRFAAMNYAPAEALRFIGEMLQSPECARYVRETPKLRDLVLAVYKTAQV